MTLLKNKTRKTRFEAEVHIGLLAIVFLLLALNFVSNIVFYRARSASRDVIQGTIRLVTMATTRAVRESFPILPAAEELDQIRDYYRLTSLVLVPGQPDENSPSGRRVWFAKITGSLPQTQLPDLAMKLVSAEPDQVTRGAADEYFVVTSIPTGKTGLLMIASVKNPVLAYLDSSRTVIIIVLLAAMFIVALAYLFLYRFIFSPFRKIRQMATEAGRTTDGGDTDVDAIVDDYQRIIDELKDDKEKLRRLNETITSRVQSLEQFNDYLLESIESGIVTLDMSGKIITVSSRAAEMLAVDPIDFQGASFDKLFLNCRSLVVDIERTVNDGHLPPYTEHRVNRPDNQAGIWGVTISTIRDKHDHRLGYSVLMTDQTELHQLQAELEGRKRLIAMGEMAGGLAHQLRNSLGAISGYGNLVKRKLTNSGLPIKPAEDLLNETEEASDLISQFLDFARPFQLALVDTSLSELLADILDGYRSRDKYDNCDFVSGPFDEVTIKIDPLLLKQALNNIIDNAAEAYGTGSGRVTLRVEKGEKTIRLLIIDRGCGILPEDIDRIFTPFFSNRPSGTGLGLPLAAKIIDLHQGSIKVDSISGQGTTFTITIPLETSARLVDRVS